MLNTPRHILVSLTMYFLHSLLLNKLTTLSTILVMTALTQRDEDSQNRNAIQRFWITALSRSKILRQKPRQKFVWQKVFCHRPFCLRWRSWHIRAAQTIPVSLRSCPRCSNKLLPDIRLHIVGSIVAQIQYIIHQLSHGYVRQFGNGVDAEVTGRARQC